MEIEAIENENDFDRALSRIDELIDCEEDSEDEEELWRISLLVWDYEGKKVNVGDEESFRL